MQEIFQHLNQQVSQCQGIVKQVEYLKGEVIAKLQTNLPELRKHVMEWQELAQLIFTTNRLTRTQDYQLTQAILDLVELKATTEPVTTGGRTLCYQKQYIKK